METTGKRAYDYRNREGESFELKGYFPILGFRTVFLNAPVSQAGLDFEKMTKKGTGVGLFSLEGARFLVCGHTSPTRLCESQESSSSCHVKGGLSEHGVDDVLDNGCEPSPFCSVIEMTQSEVLFDNVSLF
jgi:hypothetical protein